MNRVNTLSYSYFHFSINATKYISCKNIEKDDPVREKYATLMKLFSEEAYTLQSQDKDFKTILFNKSKKKKRTNKNV
jgi:hypothetical protein